jgi:hypothetical protein
MRWFAVLGISLFTFIGFSQKGLEEIDLKRIPQEKIRNFITKQIEHNIKKFSDIEPSYEDGQDLTGFRELESTYLIKERPDTVWNEYKTVSPAKSWNGRMISFGLLFSKWTNFIMYRNDNNYSGIDTGQVFYVNLKIMGGLYNLAVALEIVGVDSVNRCIKFSYLKGGKSQGEQTIHFISTGEGYTRIIHRTAFRSDSHFRDKVLYPFFHRIAINEFHRNMKHSLLVENKSSTPKHHGI